MAGGLRQCGKIPAAELNAVKPQQPPAFLTLYFDSVDHAGHEYGPDTAQTTAAVAQVDLAIGQLVEGLKRQNQAVNLVIVSDHGMAATSPERTIALDKITDPANFRVVTSGTYAGIEAKPGQDAQLATALLKPHEHMQCWRKQAIPARLEFGHNPRVPNFICMAEVGWLIVENSSKVQNKLGGAHGYDNLAPEMQAIFIANGPDFRNQTRLPVIDNLSVYPLLMHLLGLPAAHGSLESTKAALKSKQTSQNNQAQSIQ